MREDRLWRHFLQPRSAVGLGLFRIVYSLALLGEVGQLIWFRGMVFEPLPYAIPSAIPVSWLLFLWVPVIVCLALGRWTRLMTVINFGLTLMTFGRFTLWEYHIDYVYCGINLLLIFVPVERAVSLDARRARQSATSGCGSFAGLVPRIHYDVLILVGIAIVYFDSVFHKLATKMWTEGLGFWRAVALPHTTVVDIGWVLDHELLMYSMGYVALGFECVFLPLMWFDRLRPLLFAIGGVMHLGILVVFPIPWFALAMLSLYLLLVPDAWWFTLRRWCLRATGNEVAKSAATTANTTQTHGRDVANVPVPANVIAVAGLAIVFSLLQLLQTTRGPYARTIALRLGGEQVRSRVAQLATWVHPYSRFICGATPHTVYLDLHFDGYDTVYTLVHVDDQGETWLPMIAPSGLARWGWSGRQWAFWSFRACGPGENPIRLKKGVRVVTSWWMREYRPSQDRAKFKILRIKYDPYDGWVRGYYQQQLAKEWEAVGVAEWQDGEFDLRLDSDALGSAPMTATTMSDQTRRVAVGGE